MAPIIGLGDKTPRLCVYIANRPPLDEYEQLSTLRALAPGDVEYIAQSTGNHWRKIFNIYAKLGFALNDEGYSRWQEYRDDRLLQSGSAQALLFSPPVLKPQKARVHIVTGFTYAAELSVDAGCIEVDDKLLFNPEKQLIVCPYFDYRQLTNLRIERLVAFIKDTVPFA